MPWDFIEETPRELQTGEHAFAVAEQMAKKIWRHAEGPGTNTGRMLGLYGGRGSGKTSVLYTILACLDTMAKSHADKSPNESPACTLPLAPKDGDMSARIYRPAESRNHDDLLFGLLRHLQNTYVAEPKPRGSDAPNDKPQPGFADARKAEVQRVERERFLRFAEDTGTSNNNIETEVVKRHEQAVSTTDVLRTAFKNIIDGITNEKSTLVLLVDDVDLQPHRTLETLEMLHLFLHRTRTIVVVAADRDLMLRSVMESLQQRHLGQPGLAGALLAKFVPYGWNVPVPAENMRFDEMWTKYGDRGLRSYWGRRGVDDGDQKARTAAERMETLARTTMPELLPPTYRGLIAMHNRLLTLRDELGAHAEWRKRLDAAIMSKLELVEDFVEPILSMCVAVDAQRPELGTLQALMTQTALFSEAIGYAAPAEDEKKDVAQMSPEEKVPMAIANAGTQIGRIADFISSQAQHPSGALQTLPHHLPILDRLGPPFLDGRVEGEARRVVRTLGAKIVALRDETRKALADKFFVAFSLNADAFAFSASIRANRFSEKQTLHIDLRRYGDGRRATIDELRLARETAQTIIDDDKLRARTTPIDLFARAQLPLMLWLGWFLREQVVTVHQAIRSPAGTDFFVLEGPQPRLQASGGNDHALLRPDPATLADEGNEAILLVDLLAKAKPDDVNQFRDESGSVVETAHKYRLQIPQARAIVQEDVFPILQDVVDFLDKLRKRNVGTVHLGFVGPDGLAFLLGQHLNAWGRIRVYEYVDNKHYQYVFDLAD